jgi:hypothetical protein
MPRLLDLPDDCLVIGDIIRLSDNYDLGPGSGPVDLLVYDPNQDDSGTGLVVLSGQKSGLVFAILPKDSRYRGKLALATAWLAENWDKWFTFTYQGSPVPIEGTAILRWNQRLMIETTDADRRPA